MGITFSMSAQTDGLEHYKLGYDEVKRLSYLLDKGTNTRYDLPVQYPRGIARIRHKKFVQVSSSDMYCLFDMRGKKLMRESRQFIFDLNDSLVFANEMHTGQWFILNFNGDTLSYAKYSSFRYKPSLEADINLVESIDWDRKSKPQKRFGFLNKNGEWLLHPVMTEKPVLSENEVTIQAFGNKYQLKIKDLVNKKYNMVLQEDSLLDCQAIKILKQEISHQYTFHSKPILHDSILRPRNADFLGGINALTKVFQENFNMHVNKNKEKRKIAAIEVVIDNRGYLKESRIIRGVNDEFDRELLRVLNLRKKWRAAIIVDEEPPDEPNTTNLIYSDQRFWVILVLDHQEKWNIIFNRRNFRSREITK